MFQHRDMTPPSSRLRIRENRSPSKVYEDTLIVERKIRSFGLFSEDLSAILMGLLKDNEELKNVIKIGFKEIEREMCELDESLKTEIKQRTKESLELKHIVNSKANELEEQMLKLEKKWWDFMNWAYDRMDQWSDEDWVNLCDGSERNDCKKWWDDTFGEDEE